MIFILYPENSFPNLSEIVLYIYTSFIFLYSFSVSFPCLYSLSFIFYLDYIQYNQYSIYFPCYHLVFSTHVISIKVSLYIYLQPFLYLNIISKILQMHHLHFLTASSYCPKSCNIV